jgi:suppressor for copper-sensitivity B
MFPRVLSTIVWATLLAVLAGGTGESAESTRAASPWQETEQTALRLIAATETAGDTDMLRLGLQFKMKPEWKVYWRSPGDAGFPPEPDWSASRNLKTATLNWPAPVRFSVLGLESLGYHDEVVLPLDVARQDRTKPLEMAGTVRYLACREICIPYVANVALTIPSGPLKPSPFTHLIDRFQANVPGDGRRHGLTVIAAATLKEGADTLMRIVAGAEAPFHAPDIYVEGPRGVAFSKPVVKLGLDARSATLDVKVYGLKELADPPANSLEGRTLTLTLVDGNRSAERRLVVGSAPVATLDRQAEQSFAVILLLAVLGGLILNLMPCVLPVLSIKLLGVIGHGGGTHRIVRLSFIFSAAGILFAFGVLAAALIGLKAAGMAIGWGIQFQQPWFLIAMTLVVTAFACNLWGFFDVRLPAFIADWGEHSSHVHGLGGHFLQGTLATLLATPCSAPFLGTAIGFALSRGAAEITAVFAALGLGLALPYLAVATFPALATRLPRSGPWMVALRRLLALALVGTGLWLLSVLAISAGIAVAAIVGVFAAVGAAFLYFAHAWPATDKRPPAGLALIALAALLVPGWLGEHTDANEPSSVQIVAAASRNEGIDRLWTRFDESAIPAFIQQGKTVFVDVTAEWCLTCKVNKSLVLNRDRVTAALSARNVVAMQADWTRPDPAIAAFLARHQRYGIPFNVAFGPGAPKGVLLPELLTEQAVLDAIAQAAGGEVSAAR